MEVAEDAILRPNAATTFMEGQEQATGQSAPPSAAAHDLILRKPHANRALNTAVLKKPTAQAFAKANARLAMAAQPEE